MSNISNVVHRWAQQNKAHGKCGNVRFDGQRLFSYWAEIARFYPDTVKDERRIVVISRRRYSHTTSGHQNCAAHATNQYFRLYYDGWTSELSPTWSEAKHVILKQEINDLYSSVESLKRKREISWRLGSLQREASALIELLDQCFKRGEFPKKSKLSRADIEKLAGAKLDRETLLKKKFDFDVRLRLKKEKIWNDGAKARYEKRRANEQAAWDERQKQIAERERIARETEAANYTKWISGELDNRHTFFYMPIALRVKGNQIETSKGASVPVQAALLLYDRLVTSPETVPGFQIGDFTVRDFIGTNGDRMLRVGCHDIPFKEIERIRGQLP